MAVEDSKDDRDGGKSVFVGLNQFLTLYVIGRRGDDMQILAYAHDSVRQHLEGVTLVVNGPYLKVASPIPAATAQFSTILQLPILPLPHAGPGSSTIRGFFADSLEAALHRLRAVLL